jgi:hypothetical protein
MNKCKINHVEKNYHLSALSQSNLLCHHDNLKAFIFCNSGEAIVNRIKQNHTGSAKRDVRGVCST